MEKEVFVSVCGTQYDGTGEANPIEVITPGTYALRNNKHFVLYEEIMEGTDSVTKNTLKVSDKEVSLKRTGATNVHMIFSTENKTSANYTTPFGNLLIGVDTKSIKVEETEEKISVAVDYALDVNYEFLADCELKVDILPRSQGLSLA